jgi:hypothetical protein
MDKKQIVEAVRQDLNSIQAAIQLIQTQKIIAQLVQAGKI